MDILVDSKNAGIIPIKDTEIVLEDGMLTITENTTVVLGIRE